MGTRAQELADQVDAVHAQLSQAVSSMNDSQWKALTAEEGWPAGVAAHHAAGSTGPLLNFVQAAANGQPMPEITSDQLNAINAQHAKDFAGVSREDVVKVINEQAPSASAYIRGLSDEQLDKVAQTPFGGPMSTEQIIRNVMIGHIQTHLANAQAAKQA